MTMRATYAMRFRCRALKLALLLIPLLAVPCAANQVWLTQGASARASDSLRLGFYNSLYTEHARHNSNEDGIWLNWNFSDNWSLGAGMTHSQYKYKDRESGLRHWKLSNRPSETASLRWRASARGVDFLDSNVFEFFFRADKPDWLVYKNLFTVTAPAVPGVPWKPRPYGTQCIYVSGEEKFDGMEHFSQFHYIAGFSLRPANCLLLALYWQYRRIEKNPDDWTNLRITGLSTTLLF